MGRKRHKKIRPSRSKKPAKAPEVFQHGPIRLSQCGNLVAFENLATPAQHKQIVEHMAGQFDSICNNIQESVNAIRSIIGSVNPLTFMVRSYWNHFMAYIDKPPEESRTEQNQIIATRMIDYIQSVIAGTPVDLGLPTITDEQYAELQKQVTEVFDLVYPHYFMCRSAVLERAGNYNRATDHFVTRSQMFYNTVRGHRYLSQDTPHLQDLLERQSDALVDAYGVDATQVVAGFDRMLRSLTQGPMEAFRDLDQFHDDTLNAIEVLEAELGDHHFAPPELMQHVLKRPGWEARGHDVFGRALGADLFDVGKVTSWPAALIDALSISPGDDLAFTAGDNPGWPTNFSLTRFRPFLKVGGHSYCFDIHGLTDNIYGAIRRHICSKSPEFRNRWNQNQKAVTEELPFRLLQRVLHGCECYRSVHYRCATGAHGKRDWAECDGILIYDRHMFVVEVRAGAFTYTAPETDQDAYFKSLAELIAKPIGQGNRFINELDSSKQIAICDSKHKVLRAVDKSEIDDVTLCCITLDQLEHIGSQAEGLASLGMDIGDRPVWSVSIDDLRVYCDVFENALVFLDFVAERKRAFASPCLRMIDELDHLGAYLHHNRYVMYAEGLQAPTVALSMGYRDELDRYYSKLWHGESAKPPQQDMPERLAQIIHLLAQSNEPGRSASASRLLGLNGQARTALAEGIEETLALQQRLGRRRPMTLFGEAPVTIVCDQKPSPITGFADACDHALAVMSIEEKREWALLHLQFSQFGLLEKVRYKLFTDAELQSADASKIERLSKVLIHTRKNRKTQVLSESGLELRY